jgi:LAO/AO transport system kinase
MRPTLIGIGGAHSGAGKTTYASQLLRSLKGWGAIKYTKTALYSSIVEDSDLLSREGKDTRRLLDAGAERVIWVRCPATDIENVLPLAVEKLSDLKGIIVEGNSAIEFLRPDIILFIFGSDPAEIKEPAKEVLRRADVIVTEGEALPETQEKARRFGRSADAFGPLLRHIRKMIDRKEKIKVSLKESSVDGKISCSLARKIAKDLSVPVAEVGKTANELRIKITDCELGCF